jgi:demethylmenaquinone methyltransferase/2-methoxy-6-polyprenyl-1,4-benzoquinol methylase
MVYFYQQIFRLSEQGIFMKTTGEAPLPPEKEKAGYVREMFASIAPRYDLLNDILSFQRHRRWRRKAVELAGLRSGDTALDVCTGTGDFALDLKQVTGKNGLVIGADFCRPMLIHGASKMLSCKQGDIPLLMADALQLPFQSNSFDTVTVGFGIRNVVNTKQAFLEMTRVAKPSGRVICLEFSSPQHWFWRPIVLFYQMRILPLIGGMLSRKEAYHYLPNSIEAFHSREDLAKIMQEAGLINISITDMNFGSVCIHMGIKP